MWIEGTPTTTSHQAGMAPAPFKVATRAAVDSCLFERKLYDLTDTSGGTMEPNYDDFSCQFSFGKQPEAATTADLHSTRCFQSCSQKAALFDDSRGPGADPCVQCPNVDLNALEPPAELAPPA